VVRTYSSLETFYALVHEEAFGPSNAFPTGEEVEAALRELVGDESWATGLRTKQADGPEEDDFS
jgi:hypothetical protein